MLYLCYRSDKRDNIRLPGIKVVLSILFVLLFFPSIYSSHLDNTLIFLSPVDVITFDPGMVGDIYSSQVIENIFEGLTRYKNGTIKIKPGLSERWNMYDNGRRWVFILRRGVKFHNGESFNAASVVSSFSTRLNNKKKYKEWNTSYTYLKSVREIDNYTVEFLLTEPYAPFLYRLASTNASIIAPSSYDGEDFSPIGTGPFRFGERKQGKFVKILRNNTYWDKRPLLSAVIFKVVKNQNWRILQLENGKADAALLESEIFIEDVSRGKKLRIISGRSPGIYYIAFNMRKGPFRDKRMRQAVAHLIKKEAVIKKIFQSFAENATSPVPPQMFGHNPELKDYSFNIKEAKRKLYEAGYKSEVDVSLYYSDNSESLENIANVLSRSARKIGLNIKRIPVPFSELVNIGYGRHDMLILGWIGDIP
ncbi:MAG: hypothetical protein KAS97_06840, partial [Candidatus Aminicenantes bacterium]|nr:hypothetical protein [Candidatus Aminicenantes bacterium]